MILTIWELDTPTLLIDIGKVQSNLRRMQEWANQKGVALRPHTKTHKMPFLAQMQLDLGARGLTVAKLGEAEALAAYGLDDLFIANELVGQAKLERLRRLCQTNRICIGVDSIFQVEQIQRVFAGAKEPVPVLVEIEVGENRCGVMEEPDFLELLDAIRKASAVALRGVFSHDGHSYRAASPEQCRALSLAAQERTLHFAALALRHQMPCDVVSVGSTPPFLLDTPILPGITELRPGTYSLMDLSQGRAIGDLSRCAATVLATIISRPTAERVVLDVGAKGLTMQERTAGICASGGKGALLDEDAVYISDVYDEHAIIRNAAFRAKCRVGEKVRIIPAHICPVCNLYDRAAIVNGQEVLGFEEIAARGRLQ